MLKPSAVSTLSLSLSKHAKRLVHLMNPSKSSLQQPWMSIQ